MGTYWLKDDTHAVKEYNPDIEISVLEHPLVNLLKTWRLLHHSQFQHNDSVWAYDMNYIGGTWRRGTVVRTDSISKDAAENTKVQEDMCNEMFEVRLEEANGILANSSYWLKGDPAVVKSRSKPKSKPKRLGTWQYCTLHPKVNSSSKANVMEYTFE